jgi:hypothetical protein
MITYVLMLDKRYQAVVERIVDMETPQLKTGASGETSAGSHPGWSPIDANHTSTSVKACTFAIIQPVRTPILIGLRDHA